MSIGIYDADWTLDRVVPFNLQAMKLSTFYKRQRQIVLRDKEFKPEQHEKVFVCKDFDDGVYPPGLLSAPNVTLIGRAFTGAYKPMSIEIEQMRPDTHFYSQDEPLLARKVNRSAAGILHSMAAAEHLRLSLDGVNVWDNYTSQITYRKRVWNVILHDDNLAQIKDGYKEFGYLFKYLNGNKTQLRMGCKFPIWCEDVDTLLNWSQLRTSRTFYAIGFKSHLDDETLNEWLALPWYKATPRVLRYEITGPTFNYNKFINGGINQLFRQAVISRSNNAMLLLKYEKGYFRDKRWWQILDLITQFQQWRPRTFIFDGYLDKEKMIDYVRWLPLNEFTVDRPIHLPTRDQIRPLFAFLRNNNPDLFADFYDLSYNSIQEA